MAWNEQTLPTSGDPTGSGTASGPGQYPRPEVAAQPGWQPSQSAAEFGMPPMAPPNAAPNLPGMNPNLVPGAGAYPAEQLMPQETYPGGVPANPLLRQAAPPVSQQAVAAGAGMAGPLPAAAQTQAPDQGDETDVDDVVWVNRTKKVIATTHGDPHRRVQLLQQLSVLYLKEKYGRTVHADEV